MLSTHIDLHTHSNASDGVLSPSDLVRHAQRSGIRVLALTDHDTTAGLHEAQHAALSAKIKLISGVEISVTWCNKTIHIVGLGVNEHSAILQTGLARLCAQRRQRAEKIAQGLARVGISGSLEGAYTLAGQAGVVGRMHFAQFLLQQGLVKDNKAAFTRYLGKGKTAYVAQHWAELPEAIGWIRQSGGEAVLAHPGRYAMTRTQMLELLHQFKQAGGVALEIATSSHTPEQYIEFAHYAKLFTLKASRGSDYHGWGTNTALRIVPALPSGTVPIWHSWDGLDDFAKIA